MSDDEDMIRQQLVNDNEHFKALLDLVPASAYFSIEDKDEIWGNVGSDEDDDSAHTRKNRKKHKKKGILNPMSTMSVTQITEMRLKGETLAAHQTSKKKKKKGHDQGKTEAEENPERDGIDKKHLAKKQSRSSKAKKKKDKEVQRREARLEELREKLRKKLEELQARKNAGKSVTPQEQKRLKRQEKKVNSKLKNKNSTHKEEKQKMQVAEGLKSPPQNKILNDNGEPVKTKFDFSIFATGNDKSRSSDLRGRDYQRLLEKVEKRKERVDTLKSKDLDAGEKLAEKMQWQNVIHKAKGEKVKDDPLLLKKAMKRKEKMKEKRKKKWEDRGKTVDDLKQKKQDKRKSNINKRKSDKKEKVRKRMIKKGRIIPGF